VVDELALGHDSLRVLWFSLVIIIPSVLHIHLHLHVCSFQKDKWAKLVYLPKINALSEIEWEQIWTEKYFCLIVRGLASVVVAVNKCCVPDKLSPTDLCGGDAALSVN
jgi:hypothetical protein